MTQLNSTTKPSNHKTLHIPTHEEFHRTYGGRINISDFDTDYRDDNTERGSSIARKILSDMRFNERCRQNAEERDEKKGDI